MASYVSSNAASSLAGSMPIRIGSAASATSTTSAYTDLPHATNTRTMSFSSATVRRQCSDVPSAYISDEDLFGADDDDEPYLSEPPLPPRSAEVWLARPLLPPVVAASRQRSGSKRSVKKPRKSPK